MTATALRAGDQVFHPRFGFGVIEALEERDHDNVPTQYYSIRLVDGGVLTVPVERAAALGLRRIVNGVAEVVRYLQTRAQPLSENPRLRIAELAAHWESPDPGALAEGVRDLLGYARRLSLTAGDKKWLARACERLSAEAARVDGIELSAARAAILSETDRLRTSA